MNHSLEYVTTMPELWKDSDPVHPELSVSFKTAPGRDVLGLKGNDGVWKAFMCYAQTSEVPSNVEELDMYTSCTGQYIIPYTVWSHEKGAGRTIINEVLAMWSPKKWADWPSIRVVTLSPQTEMAESFHIRNGAIVFRRNAEFVNFEYEVANDHQD